MRFPSRGSEAPRNADDSVAVALAGARMALRRLTTVAKNHLRHPPVSFPSAISKRPSWGANTASAEAVTEARRRAVSVPVRRGLEDGGCDGPLQSGRRCRTCDTGSDPLGPVPHEARALSSCTSCPSQRRRTAGSVRDPAAHRRGRRLLAVPSCFWVDATILVTDEVAPCPLGPSFDPRYNRTGTQ